MVDLTVVFGTLLAVTGPWLVGVWWYSRRIPGSEREQAMQTYDRAVSIGASGAAALAIATVFATGGVGSLQRLAASAFAVPVAGLLAQTAGWAAAVATGAVAAVVALLAVGRQVRRSRLADDTDGDGTGSVGRLLAVVAATSALATVVFVAALSPAVGLVGKAVLVVPPFVVLYLAQPSLVRLAQSTHVPTGTERDTIDRACGTVDFEPAATHVIEAEEALFATVIGRPRKRELFVSEPLLAVLDDEELSVIVGLNAARARRYHRELRFAGLLGVLTVVLALIVVLTASLDASITVQLAAIVGSLCAIGLLLGGYVHFQSRLQRRVFSADAEVADLLGTETVCETMETLLERHDAPREQGRLLTLVRGRPSHGDRIDRLRGTERLGQLGGVDAES